MVEDVGVEIQVVNNVQSVLFIYLFETFALIDVLQFSIISMYNVHDFPFNIVLLSSQSWFGVIFAPI